MKNSSKYSLFVLLLLIASCKKEVEPPKVRYESPKEKAVVKKDTAQLIIADLPINFDGTNYLIHPIGNLNVSGNDSGSYSRTGDTYQNFTVSNNSDNEITGYLKNLNFQEIGKDSIRPLSTKPILIQTATYLKSIAEKYKQQLLVYTLTDDDTNKDSKVDSDDIKTLYVSRISGDNFTKLTPDFQELIDWNSLDSKSRLYFRTVEDSNKNGAFDKADKIHYYFVDLLSKDWKANEYFPVK